LANYQQSASVPLAPYVPAYDADQYAKVIQYKQGQYDTNVSRIQSSLDKADQLEILNHGQNQYKNQLLEQTTSELNRVAGSDFSQNAITSQAMGVAGKIYKDPVVQTGVMSTQQVKSLIADQRRKKLKDPSSYTPSVEYLDNLSVSAYINNPDLNAQYSGPTSATTYNNYHEPLMKMLGEKGATVERVMLPGGAFTYKVTETSKITPSEITSIVDGFFNSNPQYQQSVKADALYNYKDYDKNSLANKALGTLGQQRGYFTNKLLTLQKDLKAAGNDYALQENINRDIINTANELTSIDTRASQYINMFGKDTPLSQIKERLHMDEVRGLYINTYEENNFKKEQEVNQEALEKIKIDQWNSDFALKLRNEKLEKVKIGIDPNTGKAAKPGSDAYDVFLMNHPAFLKEKKDAETKQAQTISPETKEESTTANMSIKEVDDRVVGLDKSFEEATFKARADFLQSKGINDNTIDGAEAFNTWRAEQEKIILEYKKEGYVGPKPDKEYLKYKNDTRLINLEKQTLINLKTNIEEQVRKDIPLSDRTINSNGISFTANSETAKAIADIKGLLKQASENKKREYFNFIVNQSKTAYQGTPTGEILNNIASRGYDNFNNLASNIYNASSDVKEKQDKEIDKRLKEKISRFNPQGEPYAEGSDKMKEAKGQLRAALIAKSGSDAELGVSEKEFEKFTPSIPFTALDGSAMMQYTDNKGVSHQIKIPSDVNVIGKPVSDQKLRMIIRESPGQITPTEGPNMFNTDNGKLNFAIGEYHSSPGKYKLYLINGNNKVLVHTSTNN
jgi:hypothetical protein